MSRKWGPCPPRPSRGPAGAGPALRRLRGWFPLCVLPGLRGAPRDLPAPGTRPQPCHHPRAGSPAQLLPGELGPVHGPAEDGRLCWPSSNTRHSLDSKNASLGTCSEACFCLKECLVPRIPTDTAAWLLPGMEGPPWEHPFLRKLGGISFLGGSSNMSHSCFSHYKQGCPSAHVWCTWDHACHQQSRLCQ